MYLLMAQWLVDLPFATLLLVLVQLHLEDRATQILMLCVALAVVAGGLVKIRAARTGTSTGPVS
jgi:hypothetical protein